LRVLRLSSGVAVALMGCGLIAVPLGSIASVLLLYAAIFIAWSGIGRVSFVHKGQRALLAYVLLPGGAAVLFGAVCFALDEYRPSPVYKAEVRVFAIIAVTFVLLVLTLLKLANAKRDDAPR